jgi:hypothetical protein
MIFTKYKGRSSPFSVPANVVVESCLLPLLGVNLEVRIVMSFSIYSQSCVDELQLFKMAQL